MTLGRAADLQVLAAGVDSHAGEVGTVGVTFSEFAIEIRGESNNIGGSLAGRILSFCSVPGKALEPGLFEACLAGPAD